MNVESAANAPEGDRERSTFGKLYDSVLDDLTSYINEYVSFVCGKKANQYLITRVDNTSNADTVASCSRDILERVSKPNTVVMYAKPNCGFCARAQAALKEEQRRTPFELDIVYGAHKNATMKGAIGATMGVRISRLVVGIYDNV